jgi:hypothetical protein
MISKSIYIELCIFIKSIAVRETLWNPFFSEEREKVDCTENRAYMHHC